MTIRIVTLLASAALAASTTSAAQAATTSSSVAAETPPQQVQNAASSGDAEAMFTLGMMHHNGEDVDRNEEEAARWFLKAAQAGNIDAMNEIGIRYAAGFTLNIPEYIDMVGEEFERLRVRSVALATGVEYNAPEAQRWFRKAAQAGSGVGMAHLGYMYANGNGVPKDDAEAVRWYRKGIKAGSTLAMVFLADEYLIGSAFPHDPAKAKQWFIKAADAGSVVAMIRLGKGYEINGFGGAPNKAEALRWYRKAAQAGDRDGAFLFQRLQSEK